MAALDAPKFQPLGPPTDGAETLQLPGAAVDGAKTDIWSPLQALLHGLNVLPSGAELDDANGLGATFTGPPQSVAVLEGGATAAAKWWAAGVAAVGGLSAITTTITHFWGLQNPTERVALIIGCAAVLASGLIAIALMVASDVRGRSTAAAAQYDARAAVTTEFLRNSTAVAQRPAADAAKQAAINAAAAGGPAVVAAGAAPRFSLGGNIGRVVGYQETAAGPEVQFLDEATGLTSWVPVASVNVVGFGN